MSDVIQDVCQSLEPHSLRRCVDIEVDAPPHMMVDGDRHGFRDFLEQFVASVLEATPSGGTIVVTADGDEDGVEVEVAHSGTGFLETPESGTRPAPDGDERCDSDVRLSDLRGIIASSGGRIQASRWLDGGTAFTMWISRSSDEENGSRKAA